MTLLVSVFAAIISTIVWYLCDRREQLKLGFMALMFWGASLMWFVDAVFEYMELGAEYFTPKAADMLNDFFPWNISSGAWHDHMACEDAV